MKRKIIYLFVALALLFSLMPVVLVSPAAATSTVLVTNLQPSWTAVGGGGVFSAYFGPPDYLGVSPGTTAVYDGRQAGIIKAGLAVDPTDSIYEDQGVFEFQPNLTIDQFAAEPVTWDVENQYGACPVWMYIALDTSGTGNRSLATVYQFVPTANPAGWHTVDAAAGLWQQWTDAYSGDVDSNPMLTLSQVAAANTGINVLRVFLSLGMGGAYHDNPNGTVAWVDKATLGGVTYDFIVSSVVTSTVLVNNLQPSWTAVGGGGVYSAYYGPPSYAAVSPGTTAVYLGREAGIIKAGLAVDPTYGDYEDQGLFAFKPGDIPIETFATQTLTYDFVNQYGTAPVWVYIELNKDQTGDIIYQYVPTSNPTSWHTEDAASGTHWQAWTDLVSGITTGPMLSLADIGVANPGKTVSRVYLTEGMGDSYHSNPNGTVAWVDKVTLGGVTYDFVVAKFTVNASVSGDHGSVSPATQTVTSGASATINIFPATGYSIASITDNSSPATIANPYVISGVTAAHNVVVTFAPGPPSTPTLSLPTNGNNAAGTSITFQWSAPTGATVYWLEVNTDANWGTGSTRFYYASVSTNSKTLTGFPNNGTTYYWRVWAGNANGWSAPTSGWSVTNGTAGGPPTTPTLSAPANTFNQGGSSITFSWSAPSGATTYWLEVNTDQNWGTGSTRFYYASVSTNSKTVTGFPNNGTTYYWRVWAGNSYGWSSPTSGWSVVNGTAAGGPPATPTLSAPANTFNQGGSTITFSWSAPTGATVYWLEVNTDQNWGTGSTRFYYASVSTNSKTVTGFPNNGTIYYWRVWAGNANGWSSPTSGWSVVNGAATAPATPTLTAPANGASVAGTSISFSWSAPSGATVYWLEVNTDQNWGTGSTRFYYASVSTNSKTVTGFPNNGTIYYWRVWAGNSNGWSAPTSGWSVTNK